MASAEAAVYPEEMSFFETLAECSIAFAGFAAIHAVLKGGTSGRALHRSFTIVLMGALAFGLSVLVLLLNQFDLSATTLWRVASAIGFTFSALGSFLFYGSHRRLSGLGQVSQAPFLFSVAGLLLSLPVLIMFLNFGGWLWPPGAPAFGAAVTMMLGSGVIALLGSFWFPIEAAIEGLEGGQRSDAVSPEQG